MTPSDTPPGPGRHRPEDLLAHIEETVDTAPVVLYRAHVASGLGTSFISANVEEQFGYPADSFLEEPSFWRDRLHPDDRSRVLAAFAEAIERGSGGKVEYRFRDAEGGYRWIQDGFRILARPAGEPAELAGYFLDVTRRKEAEEKLRASEERFRELAEHIDEIFWLNTPDNQEMLYLSPAYEDVFGRPCREVYEDSRAWLEAVHPDDRDRVKAALSGQIDGAFDEEFRIVRPDGEVRWIRDRAFPIRGEDGDVERIAGVAQDVTDRRRAVRALEETERYYRTLLENAADVILHLDTAGRIRYASPSAERILDRPLNEIVGHDALEFVHPDDRERLGRRFSDLLAGPADATVISHRLLRSDGSIRHAESIASNLVPVPAVGGVVVNTRDVTEEVELESQLLQAQKMEAVGRLAGGVAHDFNNILTVVEGHAELLLQELPRDSSLREDAAEILDAARRASGLTGQLLAFGRRQLLEARIVDLSDCVRDMTQLLTRIVREDVEIRLDLDDEPALIRADPTQLEQVILNLAVNARDAMPNGGVVTIRTRREGRTDRDAGAGGSWADGACVLQVEDTGEGIPPEVQERIFEPFFSTREEGSGLGLATVYGIVQQSGGTVEVASEPGAGTRFTVSFPAVGAKDVTDEEPD